MGPSSSGTLKLTAGKDGVVTGVGTVKLPPILGGGDAKLDFTSQIGMGVTAATIQGTTGSLGQMIGLNAIKLSYSAGN
jgi:hypothetical protein